MIPGVALFYSGLLRRKNALSQLWLGMVAIGVVSFQVGLKMSSIVSGSQFMLIRSVLPQWFLIGYSLTFSSGANAYIGDLREFLPQTSPLETASLNLTFLTDHFAMQNTLDAPSIGSTRIPMIVHSVYQLMFAIITYVPNLSHLGETAKLPDFSSVVLAAGAIAERGKLGPMLVFMFVWETIVYDPIACWTWNATGWSFVMGGLDFAGGTPVHIASGTAALAISIYLGKRRGYGTERLAYKPHNTSYVVIGTCFLWFGWFGFNGGSALSANLRAANACIITNLAASVGGLTWMLWDYRLERKWSVVGFCSGAIVGLVAITPASGYVGARECVFLDRFKTRAHTPLQRPRLPLVSPPVLFATLPPSSSSRSGTMTAWTYLRPTLLVVSSATS